MDTVNSSEITKEQIEAYNRQRLQECGKRIAEVLKEFDCELIAEPVITDGRIVATVQLKKK